MMLINNLVLGEIDLQKKPYITSEEMNGIEINKYITQKCYDCCHFKKENMELYKLYLPNGIVNILLVMGWAKKMYVELVKDGDDTKI